MNIQLLRPEAIEILLRAKAQILKNPKQFRMYSWVVRREVTYFVFAKRTIACGCIATHIISVARSISMEHVIQFLADGKFQSDYAAKIQEEVQDILGLPMSQLNLLFHTSQWPMELQVAFEDAKNDTGLAKVGASAIEHFIVTNQLQSLR